MFSPYRYVYCIKYYSITSITLHSVVQVGTFAAKEAYYHIDFGVILLRRVAIKVAGFAVAG